MEAPPRKRNPAASFTDDIIAEILRRIPIRSVCQFKCVSRSWRKLISYSVHRKKLPQTLEGFFYHSYNSDRCPSFAHHFTNVTGKGLPFVYPSFSFLGVPSEAADLLDSCNGLLLCYWNACHEGHEISALQYAVCNPATHKWEMLPDSHHGWEGEARLGFDPMVSSHFHVISYVLDEGVCVTGVEIYSSKFAAWSFKESEWGDDAMLHDWRTSVFLHGFINVLTFDDGIVAVDMDGETWKTIPIPSGGDSGCIHQSQGRLYLLNTDNENPFKLSIWILEDYDTHKWTLKHSVCTAKLFRKNNLRFYRHYEVIAVHPECNLIFFVFGSDNTLMAYEMDRKEVRVIRKLGHDCSGPYLPCVPMWSALANEQRKFYIRCKCVFVTAVTISY